MSTLLERKQESHGGSFLFFLPVNSNKLPTTPRLNTDDGVAQGTEAAAELEEMFLSRQPEELFPAEDHSVWQGWCDFFS